MTDLFEKFEETDSEQERRRLAAAYVRSVYPEFDTAPLAAFRHGQQGFVFATEDDVIKVARNQWISGEMAFEAQALQLVYGKLNLATPALKDFQPGKHIVRMSKLPGQPLTSERLAAMTPERQRDIAGQIGRFAAELHLLSLPDREAFEHTDKYWRKLFLQNLLLLFNRNAFAGQEKRLRDALEYALGYESIDDDRVLVHGDLQSGNILLCDETDALGIIDFTGAAIEYRHREFAPLLYGVSEELVNTVLDTYGQLTGAEVNRDLMTRRNDVRHIAMWDPDKNTEFRL